MDTHLILETLKDVLKDKVVFLIFEACIFSTFIYALHNHIKNIGSGVRVKRGGKSIKYFYEFTIVFITIVLIEIINLMNWANDYKIGIYLINLGIILYLGFYNGWFKNQLVGIISKLEDRWDSHS